MKNIHLIPTYKSSRLTILNSGKLNFGAEIMSSSNSKPQHIYITNDKEIKEGDWYYYFGHIVKYDSDENTLTPNCKNIILTTDQELIADGVQTIDDEFLEWFVKNPSCEKVETKIEFIQTPDNLKDGFYYKIIIPKEEPTEEAKQRAKNYMSLKGALEPKQETLKEAAEKYMMEKYQKGTYLGKLFIEGAKWQQERMYSEEDLREAFKSGRMVENYKGEWEETYSDEMTSCKYEDFNKWFEQFKKK